MWLKNKPPAVKLELGAVPTGGSELEPPYKGRWQIRGRREPSTDRDVGLDALGVLTGLRREGQSPGGLRSPVTVTPRSPHVHALHTERC